MIFYCLKKKKKIRIQWCITYNGCGQITSSVGVKLKAIKSGGKNKEISSSESVMSLCRTRSSAYSNKSMRHLL